MDTLLALLHEVADAIVLDLVLVVESKLFLYLNLHPQALAVEAVLIALPVASHRVEALPEILIGATPGMMDSHRIVGGDRTVDERPALGGGIVAVKVFMQDAALIPPVLHALFQQR